jgi:hypothetical protein
MKPTSSRRFFHATITLVCIPVFALGNLTPIMAQPSASADTSSITAREEELRRKEAELIKAMGMSNATSPVGDSKEIIEKTITVTDTRQEIATSTKDSTTEVVQTEEKTSQELVELKAIGSHPALESRKVSSGSAVNAPSTIKTRTDRQGKRDDTARKLDTFRRVEQGSSFESISSYGSTRAKLISLDEIEQSISSRPQPYSDPEIATIGLRSAKLRTGPSSRNVTLGSLPEFSEVSIDYRSGDWYRVKTPTGARGWVQGKSLLFDAGISPRSTIHIGAVRAEPGARVPR